ncbi:MAG TPA: aminopeptidase P N-terminal domain-containing protein, partial [Chthonomonadaceae bacterium]|nr:aminopeptidase P N-terminal domain-containing protein [Chthonomonadaceae bacterium]
MNRQAEPFYQKDFPPAEFAARRQRVAEQIGGGAAAVLRGGVSTGAFDVFRQTNEFYYLSGVEVPHACQLIRGGSAETTLYLLGGDAHAKGEGKELNADEPEIAIDLTGVQEVKPLDALARDLRSFATIYLPFGPGEGRMQCRDTLAQARKQRVADPWEDPIAPERRFRNRLAAECPSAQIHDLSPILDGLRLIKSPREIDLMRRAGEMTAVAVHEAMRETRAGMFEYELGAIADCIFIARGAKGGAYRPIIAGGANIWNG